MPNAFGYRPTANLDEPRNGHKSSDAWHPMNPESFGSSSQSNGTTSTLPVPPSSQQKFYCIKCVLQSAWTGPQSSSIPPTTASSTPASAVPTTTATLPNSVNTPPAVPMTCNWTEHTSPDGFKYYYNSVTQESKDLNYAQLKAAGSVIDPAKVQQGISAAQEWALKNKPAGPLEILTLLIHYIAPLTFIL
ncbi:hypothetical protein B296_00021469 [Ensete ventricosum]|uniref:WW domain-containing protein n=1 Tax=Ensete ventricosum TaxID=4639 RepID=A0A427AZV4_ENSVE|nr:hypothetical protein B296_00021469 [Ensete ventricosum]